eukprot:9454179-Lingulodinium_polyedra.AAC.1
MLIAETQRPTWRGPREGLNTITEKVRLKLAVPIVEHYQVVVQDGPEASRVAEIYGNPCKTKPNKRSQKVSRAMLTDSMFAHGEANSSSSGTP